jgi:hypothetical protein
LKPIQAGLVSIVDIDCFLSTQNMKTIFKAKILLYQEQRSRNRKKEKTQIENADAIFQ